METEEAIEKLNNGSEVFETDSILDMNILELIALLQQGEALKAENVELRAYKEMWGWLDNIINSYYGTEYQREFTTQQIREHMGDLEQKY